MASMNIMADDVKTIDAAKVSKITFSGDNVTIKYNDGTPDLTVDRLDCGYGDRNPRL